MNKKNEYQQDKETQIIQQKKSLFKRKSEKMDLNKDFINVKLYDGSEFRISVRSIEVYADQILGSRNTQQDMYSASPDSTDLFSEVPKAWAVVCDGMGGMSSGELASKTASDVMTQILTSTPLDSNIPDILTQAVSFANEEVKKISAQKSELTGTTLVCAVAYGDSLYCASVGDSRIYLCRGNEIIQLTRDHNYSMELDAMVESGEITQEEALASSQREALISFVGIDNLTLVDVTRKPIKLQNEDVIILCSDGVTKVLSNEAILNTVNANKSNIKSIVDALLFEVQLDPARKLDNTTIAVLKYINN